MVLLGTRYSPSPAHPHPHHPGYTPTAGIVYMVYGYGSAARLKGGVGLRSVDQLTLDAHISGFRGITEGYNLVIAGNPNDHFLIPGTE